MIAFAFVLFVMAQERGAAVEIRLASGTALEQRGREQLERILTKWDLSPWLFTRTVQIQSRVIPHSHPVLTLNTQYVEDDERQLATFIHEQLHWFAGQHKAAGAAAGADFERMFPDAPDALPDGANGRESTYLHLIICQLEFDGTSALIGEAAARKILGSYGHYKWVYRQVLDHSEKIREVLRRHGLDKPDARK